MNRDRLSVEEWEMCQCSSLQTKENNVTVSEGGRVGSEWKEEKTVMYEDLNLSWNRQHWIYMYLKLLGRRLNKSEKCFGWVGLALTDWSKIGRERSNDRWSLLVEKVFVQSESDTGAVHCKDEVDCTSVPLSLSSPLLEVLRSKFSQTSIITC